MRKKTNQEIYEELCKHYTDEEIVESMFLPAAMTEEEEKAVHESINEARMKRLAQMTPVDHILSSVRQLALRILTCYKYPETPPRPFGQYLKDYLRATRRSQKQLAEELGINHTLMSKLVNSKAAPNKQLCYRLEKHSDGIIEAIWWWQLYLYEVIHEMNNDKRARAKEEANVSRTVLDAPIGRKKKKLKN